MLNMESKVSCSYLSRPLTYLYVETLDRFADLDYYL